jgi:hypothetical protein
MVQNKILTSNGGQQILNESSVDSTFGIAIFVVKDFLLWWYIRMSLWHLRMLGRISTLVDDNMSISLLLKNFFVPWHRDYKPIGYIFGILIKIIYLPIAISAYLLLTSLYLLIFLLWLLLPPFTLFFILRSFFTL